MFPHSHGNISFLRKGKEARKSKERVVHVMGGASNHPTPKTGVLGGGGGRGRCQSVTRLDHHGFRVETVSTKHCSRPKGRNDGRIASFSHRTRGGYKNLPPPKLPKEPVVI